MNTCCNQGADGSLMIKILVTRIVNNIVCDIVIDPLGVEERSWLIKNSHGVVEEQKDGSINVYAEFEDEMLATEYCIRFDPRDQITSARVNSKHIIDVFHYDGPEEW